jgi:hypothetical protein
MAKTIFGIVSRHTAAILHAGCCACQQDGYMDFHYHITQAFDAHWKRQMPDPSGATLDQVLAHLGHIKVSALEMHLCGIEPKREPMAPIVRENYLRICKATGRDFHKEIDELIAEHNEWKMGVTS